ncbi:beta-ketoacyl-ACP synthase 3 [Gordonia sp. TBRC 11910]|uniref:Beta-ketoacyl-ACP synthase 3 n=1 Tax=Gordonia asplenii TaxID=2725283 RepID=A0A848KSU5_9ACTN|nr:beta-ketoacyl-ACP synthase 3 [Gordonia asplenii]NMO01756.1 beta-ketoacyl-ACP synthase 3 [Gordonia asplenii]
MSQQSRGALDDPGAPARLQGAALKAVGVYRPATVIPNSAFGNLIDGDPDAWLRRRTGIVERRYAGDDETVVTMAVAASRDALDAANIVAAQLDCVIVATSTHMQATPSAAVGVAHRLGTAHAAAFDVSAGCAGFSYALSSASDQIAAGTSRHVLVVGSEKLSANIDRRDRATAPLFGDGAGAVIVGVSPTHEIGPVVWGSDGSKYDVITQSPTWGDLAADPTVATPAVAMDGPAVFRWATSMLPKITAELLGQQRGRDIRAFIPHQANARIIDHTVRALPLESVAVATDLVTSGNTSAASIPLAMHALLTSGDAKPGDLAALVGFGAGMCWAGQLVNLPVPAASRPQHLTNQEAG